jgi:hypothetical protein
VAVGMVVGSERGGEAGEAAFLEDGPWLPTVKMRVMAVRGCGGGCGRPWVLLWAAIGVAVGGRGRACGGRGRGYRRPWGWLWAWQVDRSGREEREVPGQ